MIELMKKLTRLAGFTLLLAGFSLTAHAATDLWWNFQNDTTPNPSMGIGVTASAWENDGLGGGCTDVGDTCATYQSTALTANSSGLIITGDGDPNNTPNHAIGNWHVDEFVLMVFDTPVILTDLYLGWAREYKGRADGTGSLYSYDGSADLTVMARTSGSLANPGGKTAGELVGAGWELVENVFDESYGVTLANSTVSSTHWLVGAYNDQVTGNSANPDCYTTRGGTDKCKFDFIKLKKVGAMKPPEQQVPLPGTTLLLGLGLLMIRARTRAKR